MSRLIELPELGVLEFCTVVPKNKEEQLVADLLLILEKTTQDFYQKNFQDVPDGKIFLTLRDVAVNYSYRVIRSLSKLLESKEQIKPFLDECTMAFSFIMKELLKNSLH